MQQRCASWHNSAASYGVAVLHKKAFQMKHLHYRSDMKHLSLSLKNEAQSPKVDCITMNLYNKICRLSFFILFFVQIRVRGLLL